MIRLVGLLCVLVCCLSVQAGDSKKAAELKWAKGVITDFLQSAKQQDYDQAELLMTRDLKETLDKVNRNFSNGLNGWVGHNNLEEATWTFGDEDISPDKDEAVIRGAFHRDKQEAKFTFRVVKDNGKWRVGYVYCGKWTKQKK
jgi:hypothetical protein